MPRRGNLRERLYPSPGRDSRHQLHPVYDPGAPYLDAVRGDESERRPPNPRGWSKLLQLLPPPDAAAVRECGRSLLRFHNPRRGLDVYAPKLCHNYYCPACPRSQHYKRTMYYARKLASLDPNEKQPTPRVVNLVFTLPPALHAWARVDPRVIPAWKKAVLRTIGGAFGYEGRQGYPVERVAFKELGAILNLHAIGDEARPWPKWAPHLDILMPAWKRVGETIQPLRTTWPERFPATGRRYADELREQLLPIATRPTLRLAERQFLETSFQTVWHVSRPPSTETHRERRGMIHNESAMHRIRYSCRPLFVMSMADYNERADGTRILTYRIERGKTRWPLMHHVPAGPALGQLESLREWMQGRMVRTHAGILSKSAYAEAARLAGHKPVTERSERGFTLKAAYSPDGKGGYVMRKTRAKRVGGDAER